jgi:hypothetical protein
MGKAPGAAVGAMRNGGCDLDVERAGMTPPNKFLFFGPC